MRSYLLAALLCAGCYAHHERAPASDAGARDAAARDAGNAPPGCLEPPILDETGFGPPVQLAAPPERRVGLDHSVAWVDDCRQHVYWVENRGQGAIAGVVVDGGRVVAGPFDVVTSPGDLDNSPDNLVARRAGDAVIVYWITRGRALRSRRVGLGGAVDGPVRELVDGLSNRLPFEAFDRGAGHSVVVAFRDAPHAIAAGPDGEVLGPPRPIVAGRPTWVYSVAASEGRTFVTWSDRTPAGPDTLRLAESEPEVGSLGELEPIYTAENILLSFFGAASVVRGDALYIAASRIDDPPLMFRVRGGEVARFELGDRGERAVLAATDRDVVSLTEEGSTLTFRRHDPDSPVVTERVRDVVPRTSSAERYAIYAERAITFVWMDGDRALWLRHRPPP